MKHEEGFIEGVRGSRIYHQCWLPEGEARASILLAHGLGEHSGRYTNVVDHLLPLGYAIYGMDYPGHGRSDGMRKHAERLEDLTETLEVRRAMVQREQPGKPVILYGHSLGGLVGAVHLLDHQDGLAGAVLSGPAVQVPKERVSRGVVAAGKVLARLTPKFRLVGLDIPGISRDPAVVQAYRDDPLVYTGKTTARLAAEILRGMLRVQVEAGRITQPILIIQAGIDTLVDREGASMLYNAVSSEDKTLKVYEDMYHELHNDPERATVLHDVEAWLEAHI
jgi:alpha-beta hydrolase superfamily lysophospholipase